MATAVAAFAASGVVAFAPLSSPAAHAATPAVYTFLNINDFHGRIDSNTVKFAGTIEGLRAAAETGHGTGSAVLMAAGDNIGASLFASFISQDQPTIDVLNALELKAGSVGNHEFDAGEADLINRVINGGSNAHWPYLAANVIDNTTNDNVPNLPPYTIFPMTADGHTINVGVIGAVTTETPALVSPTGVAGIHFTDPVAAVNKFADQLTDGNNANGEADLIIAEYHEGAPAGDPNTLESQVAASPMFASIVNDTSAKVAAIFTGHTHMAYAWQGPVPGSPGQTRPILQTGSYATNVGKVELTVDVASGTKPLAVTAHTQTNVARVTTADSTLISTYSRVSAVNTVVQAALANAATVGNVVKGSVAADITTAFAGGTYTAGKYTGGARDDRAKESTLGDLVADSLLDSLKDSSRGGAEIGVINPGGLRAELLKAPDTAITYAEANAVLPFLNNLGTNTMTGAQFKTLLEQQWQRDGSGNVPTRPYLQLGLSSNVTYTFDPTLPEGSRITSITVNGQPIDPTKGYRIGTISFLLDGGDNFRAFTLGTDRRDSGLVDRDAWIDYITAHSPLVPDFARQAVQTSTLPSVVVPGQPLNFTVSQLDLTSLGSPLNTTVDVKVGGKSAGSVTVTGGAATINSIVPSVPAGKTTLVLTAQPSGTTVTIPVTVAPTLTPVAPTRLFDTRAGQSPDALRTVPKVKVGTTPLEVSVVGLTGLTPASGVGAVSLNVAATNVTTDSFVTVYDCGTRQLVANVNVAATKTVSNAVIAPTSATGTVCFYANNPVDLVVDVNGWAASGSAYTGVSPTRVFDTRPGESTNALRTVAKAKVGGANVLEVKMTGLTGLTPATGVGAVALNVAVTNPAADGFVTVYACGTRQLVASVNYLANQTVSNLVVAPLSPTGTVCFYSLADTDIVVDIDGWFATGTAYSPVGPVRVFDTRAGESPNALRTVASTKVGGSYVLEVKVTGLTGITPATGVGAVAINLAATNATADAFVTAYGCGTRPFAANVNVARDGTTSNAAIVPVSADGTICFYANQPVDLVADLNGWFSAAS